MTTRTRLYLCIIVTLVATTICLLTIFTGYFQQWKISDFMQGFSGGIAFGALLGIITFAIKLKQEKEGVAAV